MQEPKRHNANGDAMYVGGVRKWNKKMAGKKQSHIRPNTPFLPTNCRGAHKFHHYNSISPSLVDCL
jgi:hypothetical protein